MTFSRYLSLSSRPSSPRVEDEEDEENEDEEKDEEDEEVDATTIGSAFRDLSRALSASHSFFFQSCLPGSQAGKQAGGLLVDCWSKSFVAALNVTIGRLTSDR